MRIYTDTVTTSANASTGGGSHKPFVSLLSDFGSRDPSAGIMRAVVAGICPAANVVDISHDVDKFSIRDGALLLWSAAPYLPIGAHVAVVDPGVGTARKGVALQTARGDYLVGPDNGLLMPAAARLGGITAVHLLEESRYALPDVSTSFHGRDIFAPAGAHLACGLAIDELGRAVDPRRLLDLAWPRAEVRNGVLRTQAIYLDTFGNVKLSALADDLSAALQGLRLGQRLVLRTGDAAARQEAPLTWAATFGEVPEGSPLLTIDSYGRVALSVHQGSAAEQFGLGVNSTLEIDATGAATAYANGHPLACHRLRPNVHPHARSRARASTRRPACAGVRIHRPAPVRRPRSQFGHAPRAWPRRARDRQPAAVRLDRSRRQGRWPCQRSSAFAAPRRPAAPDGADGRSHSFGHLEGPFDFVPGRMMLNSSPP